MTELWVIAGFALAAYSIVANDAIQTLGTFLASNSRRPWWLLWLFSCSIMVVVLLIGWRGGDVSYGRLEKFPLPEGGIRWIHAVPPLCLLILTRLGIPVSTTFLVLTTFAPGNLSKMLTKSLLGYAVAFGVGFLIYQVIASVARSWLKDDVPEKQRAAWTMFQWSATAFLWSNWLIQDLANIFVYLPRELQLREFALATVFMMLLHAFIFYFRGGAIQKIVESKSHTTDVRAASMIDLLYGVILFVFKEISKIPMSTTWVFLGLLAGREIAMALRVRNRSGKEASRLVLSDAAKATTGLAISVILALGLPKLELNRPPSEPTEVSAPGSESSTPVEIEPDTAGGDVENEEPSATDPAADSAGDPAGDPAAETPAG